MTNAFETIKHGLHFQENAPEGVFNSLQKYELFLENMKALQKLSRE